MYGHFRDTRARFDEQSYTRHVLVLKAAIAAALGPVKRHSLQDGRVYGQVFVPRCSVHKGVHPETRSSSMPLFLFQRERLHPSGEKRHGSTPMLLRSEMEDEDDASRSACRVLLCSKIGRKSLVDAR